MHPGRRIRAEAAFYHPASRERPQTLQERALPVNAREAGVVQNRYR
jgi:hypothetical protein